ncbi:MAG TPA: hypothetical protein VFM48_07695 [Aquabacterium sp.]|nr:hypothetical protein [Aquabacterium sp.]
MNLDIREHAKLVGLIDRENDYFRSEYYDAVSYEHMAKLIGRVLQAALADDPSIQPESGRWHEPLGGRREDLQPLIDKLLKGEL